MVGFFGFSVGPKMEGFFGLLLLFHEEIVVASRSDRTLRARYKWLKKTREDKNR
jgi:hypothetical protein